MLASPMRSSREPADDRGTIERRWCFAGGWARAVCLAAAAALVVGATGAWGQSAVDQGVRAGMLRHRDGLIAHVESQYNDLFIAKRGAMMTLATRFKTRFNIHSMVN